MAAKAETKPASTAVVAKQARDVRDSARHLEKSAGAVEKSTHELTDSADRRTELAADRTVLAAERTYAAWVRTALASLASGVGARALFGGSLPDWLGQATGTALILFSLFCLAAAVWRQGHPGAPPPRPDTPALPRLMLIAINIVLGAVSLTALVTIWLARPGG